MRITYKINPLVTFSAQLIAEHTRPGWSAGFIQVEDGLKALQNMGRFVRSNYNGPVVGITGSAGKTTTRALVGLVLEVASLRWRRLMRLDAA